MTDYKRKYASCPVYREGDMMLFTKSKAERYGIAQANKLFCIVCSKSKFSPLWIEDEQALQDAIPKNAEVVYAIPHQHIWRKVLFFSKNYRHKDLHSQIIRILSQELPLPIEEIRFDYQIQNMPNGIRLSLFALRNTFHTIFRSKQTIWDCELHCITRALLHQNNQSIENIEQFCFPLNQQYFYFQNDGIHFSSNLPAEKELLKNLEEIPVNKQSLYLSALGASLWNGTASI